MPLHRQFDEISLTSSQPDVIPYEHNDFMKELIQQRNDVTTPQLEIIEEQTEATSRVTSSGYAAPSSICKEKVCTSCNKKPMTSSSSSKEVDMTSSLHHSFNNASYHEVELKHYPKEQHARIVSTNTSSRVTSSSLVRGGYLRRSLNHNIGSSHHKVRDVTRPSSLILSEERVSPHTIGKSPSPIINPYEKVTLNNNYENVHYHSSSNLHNDVSNQHSLRQHHHHKTGNLSICLFIFECLE